MYTVGPKCGRQASWRKTAVGYVVVEMQPDICADRENEIDPTTMLDSITRQCRRWFGRDKAFYKTLHDMLGIVPDNIELYKLALVHRSASVMLPDGKPANNERLEYLGDAVLEAIVSEYLFLEYPEQTEGFLTQMRSRIVSRASLNDISERIGLDRHIVSNFSGVCQHRHLYGNALEALIGAIYLDKGYDFVNRFVINDLLRRYVDLDDITNREVDFKSRLIEWCQKSKRSIHFNTVSGDGSSLRSPVFTAKIIIDGIELGHGTGGSKKEAEQKAAWAVSQILGNDDIGDYFLNTVDSTMERYSAANGSVN